MTMNVFGRFGVTRSVVKSYPVHEDCVKVIDGLTYSVAQMVDLVNRGLPVNSVNVQQMALQPGQGVANPSWDVDPSQVRGFDIADAWELQVSSREKIRNAYVEQSKKPKE